jgi:4-carboxymuconolactone decarboxylase
MSEQLSDKDEAYFLQGVELQREIFGDARADGALARYEAAKKDGTAETVTFPTRMTWGFLNHRPQLALRDRAIAMLVCDIVLVRPLAMRDHARLALYTGVTRAEINEILFHLSQYCGFPTVRESGEVIRALFQELDAEAAKSPPAP